MIFWLACTCNPPEASLPRGTFDLSGGGAVGQLVVDEACRIALFGPSWDTGSPELRSCTDVGDGWLELPFRTGAGEGTVVAHFDGEQLKLELGAREGEFGVVLSAGPGDLTAGWANSSAAVDAHRDAWEAGRFRVQVGDLLVGELEMASDREVWLRLYDPSWMTEDAVQARVYEDGPELVLNFPVMPRLMDADGLIRVNRPLLLLVVPVAAEPDPDDRVLQLVPGTVTDEERAERVAWALDVGGQREKETVLPVLKSVAEVCAASEDHALVLTGYEVQVTAEDDDCVVQIDPDPVQHRRRMSARVRGDEIEEVLLRPL